MILTVFVYEKAVVYFRFFQLSAIALKNPANMFETQTFSCIPYIYYVQKRSYTVLRQGNMDDGKDDVIIQQQFNSITQ